MLANNVTNKMASTAENANKKSKRRKVPLILFLLLLILGSALLLYLLGDIKYLTSQMEGDSSGAQQGKDHSLLSLFNVKEGSSSDLLILVNPWHAIPEDYSPTLLMLSDGQEVDAHCYDELLQMLSDCEDAGNQPYICSAYRTQETQQSLFDNKVERLMDSGLDRAKAEAEAAHVVAVPGTSEHQLGLAVDIIDSDYTQLDEGQEDTDTQKWLMENSWRYGFILRYPSGKSDVTGIIYEPWHYRYVGKEAAQEIYELGVTLEEYLAGS